MAYTNYIAESLDKSIESSKLLTEQLKTGKVLESKFQFINEEGDVDVNKYYDEEEGAAPVQPAAQGETVDQPTTEEPVAEPVQGEELPTEEPVEPTTEEPEAEGPVTGIPNPGDVVAIGDQTGEVMATNPQNGFVIVKLDVLDEEGEEQEVEVHESKVTRLGNKLKNIEKSLTENLNTLILETKKRKASEQDQPHFLMFLTEKRKAAYYSLPEEDKTKVKLALKESEGKYTSEAQVISIMNEALSPKRKSFNELLIESMPAEIKPIWEKLEESVKQSVLTSSRLFPSLDTVQKFESFWYSRDLERYTNEKPSKQLITENRIVDGSKLTESQLDRFKTVFDKLNS